MARLVLKFGGTSVADVDAIKRAAGHVIREVKANHQVVVVVSAMSGETSRLLDIARKIYQKPDKEEQDVICATGEQVTAALMAIELKKNNLNAKSMLGWQIPIITDDRYTKARIEQIEGFNIEKILQKNQIPVVAGFQGINQYGRIVTLGRGGSDLTAIAIAAKINAEQCDIYSDVEGVHVADPRIVPEARKIKAICYEEMLEMASLGVKVIQNRAIAMALKYKVKLRIRSSFVDPEKLQPFLKIAQGPGTFVLGEKYIMEKSIVSGITYKNDEAKITIVGVDDKPGMVAKIFQNIADQNVNVDMIVQGPSIREGKCNVTFTIQEDDLDVVMANMKDMQENNFFDKCMQSQKIAKISIIGIGMKNNCGVAAKMFKVLADKNINIQSISTSEIKTSVLIDEDYTELAVRALHEAYEMKNKHKQ